MSLDTHSPRRPVVGDPDRYVPDPRFPLDDQPNPSVGWELSSWFKLTFEVDPSDGLTVTSTAHHEIVHRTVTPEQLRTYACHLIELAGMASLNAAPVECPPTSTGAVTGEGLVA
jgi:hypothetical protein